MFDNKSGVYLVMEIIFVLNGVLSVVLIIYMTQYLIFNSSKATVDDSGNLTITSCRDETPILWIWIVVETVYNYAEVMFYLGFVGTAWAFGDRIIGSN